MKERHSYRAYFLSASDHIRSVKAIKTLDDTSAAAQADDLLIRSECAAIEIWKDHRLVVRKERARQVAHSAGG
jgi:hypothetical protein